MRGARRPVECGYFVSFYELICASACEQLDAFLDDHAISGRKIDSRRNGTRNNCRFFFFLPNQKSSEWQAAKRELPERESSEQATPGWNSLLLKSSDRESFHWSRVRNFNPTDWKVTMPRVNE